MTTVKCRIPLESRIQSKLDQLVYARQSEWTRWGLFIDRLKLRNLAIEAVMEAFVEAIQAEAEEVRDE